MKVWWGVRDLNPRPRRYERPALTTELTPLLPIQPTTKGLGMCYNRCKATAQVVYNAYYASYYFVLLRLIEISWVAG